MLELQKGHKEKTSWSLELGMRKREKLHRESHSWSQIRESSQAEGTRHLTSVEILMLWEGGAGSHVAEPVFELPILLPPSISQVLRLGKH